MRHTTVRLYDERKKSGNNASVRTPDSSRCIVSRRRLPEQQGLYMAGGFGLAPLPKPPPPPRSASPTPSVATSPHQPAMRSSTTLQNRNRTNEPHPARGKRLPREDLGKSSSQFLGGQICLEGNLLPLAGCNPPVPPRLRKMAEPHTAS